VQLVQQQSHAGFRIGERRRHVDHPLPDLLICRPERTESLLSAIALLAHESK
jgi:hypothetical protein